MKTFLIDFYQIHVFDNKLNSLWDINWVLFDIDYEKIVWFIYKKNFLTFDYFLLEDIISMNKKIIIKSKNKINSDNYYDIIWKKVKNEDLENIWIIEDIEFDLTYKLKNIIIDCWYIFSSQEIINNSQINIKKDIRKINKNNILSYEKNYILLNDKNILKKNKKILENISKIFINIPKPIYNINKKKYE